MNGNLIDVVGIITIGTVLLLLHLLHLEREITSEVDLALVLLLRRIVTVVEVIHHLFDVRPHFRPTRGREEMTIMGGVVALEVAMDQGVDG